MQLQDAAPNDSNTNTDSGGGSDSGVPTDAGGQCSFVGSWQGTIAMGAFAGQTLRWSFTASTWTAGIASGSVQGTWSYTGTTLDVNDTSSMPATLACPAAERGRYTATFDGTCATVRLAAITEPCDGRRAYADGITLARQ
jgi:hypothetical protein